MIPTSDAGVHRADFVAAATLGAAVKAEVAAKLLEAPQNLLHSAVRSSGSGPGSTGSDNPIQWKRRPNPVEAAADSTAFCRRFHWKFRRFHCILRPLPLDSIVASTGNCGCFHWKLRPLPLESAVECTGSGGAFQLQLPPLQHHQKEFCRTLGEEQEFTAGRGKQDNAMTSVLTLPQPCAMFDPCPTDRRSSRRRPTLS